jgi:hypothetical protein
VQTAAAPRVRCVRLKRPPAWFRQLSWVCSSFVDRDLALQDFSLAEHATGGYSGSSCTLQFLRFLRADGWFASRPLRLVETAVRLVPPALVGLVFIRGFAIWSSKTSSSFNFRAFVRWRHARA